MMWCKTLVELWAKHSRRRLSRGGAKDSNNGLYGADVQILVETEGLDCIAPLRWLNGPLLQYCLEQYWIKGWHWDIAARLSVRGQNCTKLGWNAQIRDILFTESSFVKEMMRHSGMTNTAVLNRRNDNMEWKQCKKRWKGGVQWSYRVHCTWYSDLTGYSMVGIRFTSLPLIDISSSLAFLFFCYIFLQPETFFVKTKRPLAIIDSFALKDKEEKTQSGWKTVKHSCCTSLSWFFCS